LEEGVASCLEALRLKPDLGSAYFQIALMYQQVGELNLAQIHYQKALGVQTHWPEAWNNLGMLHKASGHLEQACDCFEKALKQNNTFVPAYVNLAEICIAQKNFEKAFALCEHALQLSPDSPEAANAMGVALFLMERLEESVWVLQGLIQKAPYFVDAYNNLALTYRKLGQFELAVQASLGALKLRPEFSMALLNLADSLREMGRCTEALEFCQHALNLQADADAFHCLGLIQSEVGQLNEAELSLKKALELRPNFTHAWTNLAATYHKNKHFELAIDAYDAALNIDPTMLEARVNAMITLKMLGRNKAAIRYGEIALAQKPDYSETWSNLAGVYMDNCELDLAVDSLIKAVETQQYGSRQGIKKAYSGLFFCLNYHPDLSAEAIYGAYQDYETRFGVPLRLQWIVPVNARVPDKRLKVGYVSAGFSNSSCKYFLEPLMAHHDHRQIEVYAYSEQLRSDEYTERYQGYADHWISTMGLSDDELTEQIRRDGIDILVDISGHTEGHRLLVFARKPAPVSIHWLDFGYTTGLKAIDYYLCDQHTVPEGSEDLFSEKPWRLDSPPFSYRPSEGMGEVGALPALSKGYITFGTLTRSIRINYRVVRAWAALLKAVPGSRLVIDSGNFKGEEATTMMKQKFAEQGISEDRLDIGFHSPPWDLLRTIDIGLDCFPHNSGTTLFEMLYMGVPFITIAGRPSVGTLGAGILEGVGHLEWIARNEEEYVEKGVQLANDVAQLARLRMALRGQMQASPVMDEVGFARSLEHAYRQMWCLYCSKQVEG
jgi:predicted O-linked N-acetylglucosamine transferase (SPINDLY family)